MAKCSFGKILLRGTFEPAWPFGTELYGRMFYLNAGGTQALIIAMDTSCTSSAEANRFRAEVAQRTGIPADHIWYHELQIHAAPESWVLLDAAMDAIIDRASQEALRMMECAVEFTCEVAEADAGTRYSMNREQYVEGLGGVTVWAGIRFDDRGRAYCQDPSVMLLRGYVPQLPVFEKPIYFDNTVDPRAYLFVFKDVHGRVIGTLSRFSAHPDVAVLFERRNLPAEHIQEQYQYNYDWPGYLSEKLEAAFQAPSMYLNGPCADLAAKKGWDGMDTYEAADAECRRIGEELADLLLERYRNSHISLGDAENCRAATFAIELPIRESFPKSPADLSALKEITAQSETALQDAIQRCAPAYEIKQLIDECYRNHFDQTSVSQFCRFDEETLARGTVMTTVSVLQLGDYLFFGVPGECLVDMTTWLRSTFTGVKTVPVDQVNGYYTYMATPRSLTLGGYTYWGSWVRRDAIPLLKEGILQHMETWQNAPGT